MNHWIRWFQDIEIVLGWPSNLLPWRRDHYFGQFWKLGFCSVSECEIFAHGGKIHILLDLECVDSIPTWKMPKDTHITYRNPVLLHGFQSMPRVGIQQVSQKPCRRLDSMCHKMIAVARINKPLTPLDSGHQDNSWRGPLLLVHL